MLLAPNGKKSNLTNSQYKLVRTPAFKKWFGDWENNPSEASKVVDENGEPLLVYHGSGEKFNTFMPNELGITYFTSNYGYSKLFSERQKDSLELLKNIYNEKH